MHAAQNKASYLLFATGLTVAAGLFVLYMWRWFVPVLQPGLLFEAVFALVMLLLLITAWAKGEEGAKGKLHEIAAYRMAYISPVFSVLIAWNTHVTMTARIVASFALLAQAILLYVIVLVPSSKKHFLYYQLGYVASTFAAILAATYV